MLKRLKLVLTARATVLTLLLLLAAAMTVGALVAQRGSGATGSGATPGRPELERSALVTALGLDHVFSTPWFAVLSLLFVLTLLLSTLDQFRLSLARLRQVPPRSGEGGVRCTGTRQEIEARLARHGYRRVSRGSGPTRHVRQAIGYWGNFLLHAGMTVTVLSSVTYALTEHRVQLHAVSGRALVVAPGAFAEKRGLLAGEISLPAEVNLYRVEPTFGANDQLVDLASQLIFTDSSGSSREIRVAVNDYQEYRGLVVYQLVKYGKAFFLELQEGSGSPAEVLLEMAMPEKRGAASYLNRPLGGSAMLRAKYYASSDRKALLPEHPQLVLRLYDGDRLVEETTLQEGQQGRLGPLAVRLARVGWWTDILFEGSRGTTGIFSGFALLLVGAVLLFFAVPREVVLRDTPDGLYAWWRTSRFPDMYHAEGERVLASCKGESPA